MQNTFLEQHLNHWVPAPEPLWDLAREYYESCEAYDRTVCTGPIRDGSIYPASPYEMALVNRNSAATLKRLREKAEQLGFGPDGLKRAMQVYNSEPHKQ